MGIECLRRLEPLPFARPSLLRFTRAEEREPSYSQADHRPGCEYSIIAISPRAVIIIADITHLALTEFHDALTMGYAVVICRDVMFVLCAYVVNGRIK